MSQRIARTASKAGYAFFAFVSSFAILYPAHRAVAEESITVPVPDMLVDLMESLPVALVIAVLVEILRLGIPWLSRKNLAGHGKYDAQKNALRLISVLLGALFGALGWASSMGDGSNPQQLGGIASGAIAALFGGQLIGAIADRIGALRSKKP